MLIFFASQETIQHNIGDFRGAHAVCALIRRVRRKGIDSRHTGPYNDVARQLDFLSVDRLLLYEMPRYGRQDMTNVNTKFNYNLIG